MPIRPEEIDPTVQNALKDRITQIFSGQVPLDPVAARVRSAGTQAWRQTARRHAGNFWAALVAFVAGLLTMPALAQIHGGLGALVFFLLAALAIGLVVRGFRSTHQELTRHVNPDLMRGAAQLVALTPAEQRYCEAVAALIDAGPMLGDVVQREILQQLNLSLEHFRKLALPLQQQQAASGGAAIAALEQERAQLEARRVAAEDGTARALLEQSAALCARRLEVARALEPAREKAEAQQELILQTLASVQASLASTVAAPAEPAAAEVEALQQSVAQMNQQARAVEEAVTEVLSLRA
jgi:hypothetical protein